MRGIAAALVVLAAAGAGAESRPAVGGVDLFSALESAPLALVATIEAPRRLDPESYAAQAVVQQVFRGEIRRGAKLQIAWEELARSRPVRFEGGETVLLALEALPGASIWRQRIPDPEQHVHTLAIARHGDAFVRDPAVGSIDLVEHFLALPPDLRDGNAGVSHLILLAEAAQPTLARAALERLAEVGDVDAALDDVSATRLVTALLRDPPELADAVQDLIAASRPERLRAALAFRGGPDGSGPARVYRALGALDGSLPEDLVAALWRRDDSAAHRAVAASYAPATARKELARRLREDPSAEVRAAAVTRLGELGGASELDRLLFAMQDDELRVRLAALRAVSALGAEAVPGLRQVVETGKPEAAQTAVGALATCGPEGFAVLREVAASHPDESVRTLARTALGGAIGHKD